MSLPTDPITPMRAQRLRLWFGIVAGPTAWFAHVSVSYAVAAHACQPGREWLFHATTAATLALAAAGIWAAWRAWPGRDSTGEPASLSSHARQRFMALAGVVLGLSFLLVIVVQAVPNLVFDRCP